MPTASNSKREVRERDASWQPYYRSLGLLENRVPQRSSGLSSFSHIVCLHRNNYIKMIQQLKFNLSYFRKLAIFSGYHRLSPSEIHKLKADEFSCHSSRHLRHLLRGPGDLNHGLIFGEPGGQVTLILCGGWLNMIKPCEITLNIIKPTTQNVGIIQNCCEVLVWECICWVLKLLWAECSQNESFLVAESCFILSIPRGPTAYRAYSWRVCSSQKEHRQHQVWTQRNQVV
jgi:hypothetical protein